MLDQERLDQIDEALEKNNLTLSDLIDQDEEQELLDLANWAHGFAIPALKFYASRTLGFEKVTNPEGVIQEGRTARIALEQLPDKHVLGEK